MINRNLLKIFDSPWVQPKRDENGEETLGYELREGAPEDVRAEFESVTALIEEVG